ncbi:MAG: hypothetical protein ACRD3J_13765 [Thermoanaerobaculia bacterium]
MPLDLFDNLSRTLLAARMRAAHRDRKASALLEPLTSRKSPYGLGYLAVKALQLRGARRDERLFDSDLFAQIVHGYFDEDWNLVDKLLTEDTLRDEARAGERLVGYMAQRVGEFAESISGPAIDAFIERSVNKTGQRQLFECEVAGVGHGFWVDEFRARTNDIGQSLLRELLEDALDLAAISDERVSPIVTWQTFISISAQVITVAGADIAASRMPHHLMLMMDDKLPSAILPYSGTLPAGWEGTLRVVAALVVEESRLIVLMFDHERLVAEFGFEQLLKALPHSKRVLTMLANPMLDPRQRSQAGLFLRE